MTQVPEKPEPFAARLHWLPRVVLRRPQALLVRLLRPYFERAPGWVLLTTVGRKTGLPREVLLPCERDKDSLLVISTYGLRADWIRNLRKTPSVWVSWGGDSVPARAEIVEDVAAKRALMTARPFFPPLPIGPLQFLSRTLLRLPTAAFLRVWVGPRPVVVIRRET